MKKPKVTHEIYCQYLLATFDNYTGSNLADQLDCCHDAVTDFLSRPTLRPRHLWDSVKKHSVSHLTNRKEIRGVMDSPAKVFDRLINP